MEKTHHGSFVQSLWVECVVPVLCLYEGVAPGLVHLATALEVTKKALVCRQNSHHGRQRQLVG